MRIIIQASSRSWSGGPDLCMGESLSTPIWQKTYQKMLQKSRDIWIAAPSWDEKTFNGARGFFGYDDDPLSRLKTITHNLSNEAIIMRVDALNWAAKIEAVPKMIDALLRLKIDCAKFPDDWPAQMGFEIFTAGWLRKVPDDYKTHIRFAPGAFASDWDCALTDYELSFWREMYRGVYTRQREEMIKASPGDQLTLHYELALEEIEKGSVVLDIACGDGYGCKILAQKAFVLGADSDAGIIETNSVRGDPLSYLCTDIRRIERPANHFDAVTCMETIEHVHNAEKAISELHRVLKPGGKLILSTPQNRYGHIPINSAHVREYSLEEIKDLVSTKFEIEKVIGIKAGRIIVPGDPIGSNTLIVGRKK